jgi:hypothetical protein
MGERRANGRLQFENLRLFSKVKVKMNGWRNSKVMETQRWSDYRWMLILSVRSRVFEPLSGPRWWVGGIYRLVEATRCIMCVWGVPSGPSQLRWRSLQRRRRLM